MDGIPVSKKYIEAYCNGDEAKRIIIDAEDEIECLRQQLSIAETNQRNVEETHKITLREVQRESMRLQTENDILRQQLAEAQAREQQLREALLRINRNVDAAIKARCGDVYHATCNRIVAESIAKPFDTATNPSTILQLLDYIEKLEKDAARYRVVFDDDLAAMKEPLFNARTGEELPEVRWTIWWNGPNKTFIRDAIDAAMQEKRNETGS